jgi:hypothetical protein
MTETHWGSNALSRANTSTPARLWSGIGPVYRKHRKGRLHSGNARQEIDGRSRTKIPQTFTILFTEFNNPSVNTSLLALYVYQPKHPYWIGCQFCVGTEPCLSELNLSVPFLGILNLSASVPVSAFVGGSALGLGPASDLHAGGLFKYFSNVLFAI